MITEVMFKNNLLTDCCLKQPSSYWWCLYRFYPQHRAFINAVATPFTLCIWFNTLATFTSSLQYLVIVVSAARAWNLIYELLVCRVPIYRSCKNNNIRSGLILKQYPEQINIHDWFHLHFTVNIELWVLPPPLPPRSCRQPSDLC